MKHSRRARTGSERGPAVDRPLRIIGGKYRGSKLAYSGEPRTRPMKARVREAIFNLVGPAAHGAHAVDLFAGTGALGLEALSRGAAGTTFVERHFPTAERIGQTIKAIGVEEPCDVIAADTFIWARTEMAKALPADRPWLAFCSPPYDFFVERRDDMLALVEQLANISPAGSLLVVESDRRFDPGALPTPADWDVRSYPPAVISTMRLPISSA